MYNPIHVVNKFIELAAAAGNPLTHMQIQKLLYIAHGVNLAVYDKPLLSAPVCAWRYGPVIPSVYNALKANRSRPITGKIFCDNTQIDAKTEALLQSIYNTYGNLEGTVLSEFTHRDGTPWKQSIDKNENIIDDEVIKKYYKRLMERDADCIGL